MNLCKNGINKSFAKSHQLNFFKKKLVLDNHIQKLIPDFSMSNYTIKNKNTRNPLNNNKTSIMFFPKNSIDKSPKKNFTQIKFHKLNQETKLIKIKKIKLTKSLSEIFKDNDVDFVRNLNIDSLAQFKENLKQKTNLINLSRNYFEVDNHKKFSSFLLGLNKKSIKNRKEKIPMMTRKSINKSYDIIQAKKKEIKIELEDIVEKKIMNRFKIVKKNEQMNNMLKKECFMRIREIDEELQEINEENKFIKSIYLKEIRDFSKEKSNDIDILDEIIKYKIKNKFFKKNKNIKNRKSFLHILNKKLFYKNSKEKLEESPKGKENKSKNEASSNKNQINKKMENFEQNVKNSNKKKKLDDLKEMQDKKVNELLIEKKNIENQIKDIEINLENNKKEIKEITTKLMMSYKETLFKGKNVKNEGLVWIIKSIWTLGQNVPMSFMPDYLDCDSIDYLFKLARKQILIEEISNQILEIKAKLKRKLNNKHIYINSPSINNNNSKSTKAISVKEKLILKCENVSKMLENDGTKKDIYKELVNHFKENDIKFDITNRPEIQLIIKLNEKIDILKKEIADLKQNEIHRIYECFLEKNYENKFHTNIETVLSALIGLEAKDAELNKFKFAKKNYISTMKQIQFFDHNYSRKIMNVLK